MRDEELSGRASGAGARTLLASIMTEQPRRSRRGRWLTAAAITGVLATAAVVAPVVVDGGPSQSYANSAIEVWRDGDTLRARIKDMQANEKRYEEAFAAMGAKVRLDRVPVTPNKVGSLIRGGSGGGAVGGRTGFGTDPAGCLLTSPDCVLVIGVSGVGTEHFFLVGRQAEPGETYQNPATATDEGGQLADYPVDEKTVGTVRPVIEARGLEIVYEIIEPSPDGQGFGANPKDQNRPVGADWVVWEAMDLRQGVVKLLVSEKRVAKNPIYGGRKSEVSKG
ncbi:hypothetical protein GCM10009560_60520 [Nonomuraea longicatena]|uniref:Uncharacterized protein n=1 Tax=Nonomuraea longicatena TaxID=83682 RepID=A0ABN1QQA0_9ACTN